MSKIIIFLSVFILCSCNEKEHKYEKLHDKYRTLWYRTGEQCFYDSSQKYGRLYEIEMYGKELDISGIDTIPTGATPICKQK